MATREVVYDGSTHDDIASLIRVLTKFSYPSPVISVSWLRLLWAEWQGAQVEIARLRQELAGWEAGIPGATPEQLGKPDAKDETPHG